MRLVRSQIWVGAVSSPRYFCKIHFEFTHFAAFCDDYDKLRLTKFTKLKNYIYSKSLLHQVVSYLRWPT